MIVLIKIIVFILFGVLVLQLAYWIHCALESCYIRMARRFCIKRSLIPSRYRCRPAFDDTGVKTEYSLVEIDCEDPKEGRQLVTLLVWIFGVHKVLSIEPFSEDEHK